MPRSACFCVSLALAGFESDDSAATACDLGGTVGRVVFVDVDGRLGQFAMKIIDHLADGQRLVIAGDDNGNPVPI